MSLVIENINSVVIVRIPTAQTVPNRSALPNLHLLMPQKSSAIVTGGPHPGKVRSVWTSQPRTSPPAPHLPLRFWRRLSGPGDSPNRASASPGRLLRHRRNTVAVFERRKMPTIHFLLTIRRRVIACRLTRPAYLTPLNHLSQRSVMEKLTQLLDSIDSAYRVAVTTDRDVAALLLLASLRVSEKMESQSHRSERRRKAA